LTIPLDFSLSVKGIEGFLELAGAGKPGRYLVTVTPVNGFTGKVALAVSSLPPGWTASFNPDSVIFASSKPTAAVGSNLTVTTAPGQGLPCATGCNLPLEIMGSSGASSHVIQTRILTFDPWIGPSSLDLGATTVGSTSAPIGEALAINGTPVTGPVTITSISLTNSPPGEPGGANGAEFSLASTTCIGTQFIGNSCTIFVKFTPAAAGRRAASLYIQFNNSLHEWIPVFGTGQ
jgi:hypothetical protein